jgi:hypothetical protein
MSDAKLPPDANPPSNDKLPLGEALLSDEKLTSEVRLVLWSFVIVILLACSTFVASYHDLRRARADAAPTVPTPPVISAAATAPSSQPANTAGPAPTAPGQTIMSTAGPSASPSQREQLALHPPRGVTGSGKLRNKRQGVSHNAQTLPKQDLNQQELDRLATMRVASPQGVIPDPIGLIMADGGPKPQAPPFPGLLNVAGRGLLAAGSAITTALVGPPSQ